MAVFEEIDRVFRDREEYSTTDPAGALPVGFRSSRRHPIDNHDLRLILKAIAQGDPTVYVTLTGDAELNRQRIQEAVDTRGHVVLPTGHWPLSRCIELPSGTFVELQPNCVIRRADGAFDNLFRNKNALAHLVGNAHPGSTHPFSARSVYWPDALGNRQEWEVNGEIRARSFDIWFDEDYHYDGANDIYRVSPGDIKTTGDGLRWQVVEATSTHTPVVNRNGVKFVPARDSGIWIVGHGKSSIIDGNGANNFDGSDFVEWQRFRRQSVCFVGVENYGMARIGLHNSAGWSVNNNAALNGSFQDIDFQQPAFIDGAYDSSGEGDEGRLRDGIGNLDGIDMRSGCRNISINRVTGQTNDDVIACTTIYPKHEVGYPHDDPEGRYPKRIGDFNTRFAFYEDLGYDIIGVVARAVEARPIGTHHQVRYLASDGRVIDNCLFESQFDNTTLRDVGGNKYSRRIHTAVALIGDKRYGRWPAGPDDLRNITINTPNGNARDIVQVRWSCRDITINGLTTSYTAKTGGGVVRRQNAIVFLPGNEVIEKPTQVAAAGQTVFPAPRGYRLPRDLNVPALLDDANGHIPFTRDVNRIEADVSGHDLSRSFRATITVQDDNGSAVPDVPEFDVTVYVETDENNNNLPTGTLFFEVNDIDGVDYTLIPATGRLLMTDKGAWGSLPRFHANRPDFLGNGSLKVWVNGVLQTRDVDYSEDDTGAAADEMQQITFAAGLNAGDVVYLERTQLPESFQMIVDRMVATGTHMRSDKATTHPDEDRRPLDWSMVVDLRSRCTLRNSSFTDFFVRQCRHVFSPQDGAVFQNVLFGEITLLESGQMPFRINPECDWENSWGEIRNLRTPDRSKIWQFYDAESHGAAPGFLGQVYSGRGVFKFTGDAPAVRPAAPGEYAADVFPQWARDGSVLTFEAGAFPGLSHGVVARKVGNYGEQGDRWVALRTLNGESMSTVTLPSEEDGGTANRLNIVSGRNFRETAPPEDGTTCWIVPDWSPVGAMTVKVDDMDVRVPKILAKTDKTPGAGWLRIGIRTPVVWSDALDTWLIGRLDERGIFSNGGYQISPAGMVYMYQNNAGSASLPDGPNNGLYSGTSTWTFPVECSGAPFTSSTAASLARTGGGSVNGSATEADLVHYAASSSGTSSTIRGFAMGDFT